MSTEAKKSGTGAVGTVQSSRVLVVYYTRTGYTKDVAEDIAARVGCDVEEILDTKKRSGILGFLSAGKDAGQKNLTTISEPKHDPSKYDLVVVGSPVWNNTVSTPIRTYLSMNKDKLANVAFFVTQGRNESDALSDMESTVALKPRATLQFIRVNTIDEDEYDQRVDDFIAQLGVKA